MGFVDAFRTKLGEDEEDCWDEDNGLESRGLRTKRRPRVKTTAWEAEDCGRREDLGRSYRRTKLTPTTRLWQTTLRQGFKAQRAIPDTIHTRRGTTQCATEAQQRRPHTDQNKQLPKLQNKNHTEHANNRDKTRTTRTTPTTRTKTRTTRTTRTTRKKKGRYPYGFSWTHGFVLSFFLRFSVFFSVNIL